MNKPGAGEGACGSTSKAGPSSDIFKVGIRVPPFWPEEPEIWFAQIEGQFAISGIINDATKFNYVIGQLDKQYSIEIKDIIVNPPATEKYEKLKSELIKRLTASKEKKLKQLLMHEELGDRKPSQFLRHLTSLAGPQVPDDFIKTIWISRLPSGTQTVLAGQPTATLEVLSDLADRIHDIAPHTPQVASTSQAIPGSAFSDLVREVAELRKQFQSFTTQGKRQARSNARQDNRGRSRSRSKSNYRKYPICWYHAKFGDKANHCSRPCDYKSENVQGGQ
ncbi:uncharacterized protein LOC123721094 [Papilio machaon]|uniref:uncharacterized protein LOC106711344 n=1 Tax=Papilio machaon TaxID=76193 RepID=UPI0006EB03FA|nr:uncharacterized protein LOC106711344 [Papilio machaon]XP_045534380.1 uncharacterized protein LOC123721094 [Papilio machaon]